LKRSSCLRFPPGVAVRVIADVIMTNMALLVAMLLRYLWAVVRDDVTSVQGVFRGYAQTFLYSFWLLTLVSLAVFHFSGFYTHGRFYSGRYKALVVAQAVSISYLIFGFLTLLLRDVIALPRSVLVISWLLSLTLLISARVWSILWEAIIQSERRAATSDSGSGVKKVLVIGGAGYIGSALLPKLLDKGYHVRLLDLLLFGTEPIAEVIDHPQLEIVQADFRHIDKVVEAVQGMNAVIHLGAIVGDPACALNEELTIEVNLMATRMIAEVAKGSGVSRFIFASTCSVYGAGEEMLDERSALRPVSLYARSKIASEQVLARMADDRFAPVILRFGTVFGLSGRTRFDLVVNLLTAKAVVDGQITVFGGDQWRPFLHVDDAALALFKALEAPLPLVRNQVFNVGSNDMNCTIQQVGEIIHRLVPTAQLVNMGSDTDRRNYRVNFNKIRRTLDYVPKGTIKQGVRQVIEAIESGRVADYRDAKYSNVKFLSEEGASSLIRSENGWAYELMSETSPGFGDRESQPDLDQRMSVASLS
jgi:nucleoside-diphosphate-sugar epimerase